MDCFGQAQFAVVSFNNIMDALSRCCPCQENPMSSCVPSDLFVIPFQQVFAFISIHQSDRQSMLESGSGVFPFAIFHGSRVNCIHAVPSFLVLGILDRALSWFQ